MEGKAQSTRDIDITRHDAVKFTVLTTQKLTTDKLMGGHKLLTIIDQ